MSETVFSKIIRGDIPTEKIYEDENLLAFRDITPQAPVHILVIPKKPLRDLSSATPEDKMLLGELLFAVAQIAKEAGLEEEGYRTVINTGKAGGQTVFHLHLHLLGGRQMEWPPG